MSSDAITIEKKGNFKYTERYFHSLNKKLSFMDKLNKCGREGVNVLSLATPKDTGNTAASWSYEVVQTDGGYAIQWKNGNVVKGWFNVALALQAGHGTRNGGFVEGVDYINPALKPLFGKLVEDLKMEVTPR